MRVCPRCRTFAGLYGHVSAGIVGPGVRRGGADLNGEHRDSASVEAFGGEADFVVVSSEREDVEERQVVVGRGRREPRVAAQAVVVDERRVIIRRDQLARPRLEPDGPVERLDPGAAPRVGVQVVDEVAAPGDEDALVAQRREPAGQLVVRLGRQRLVYAQLNGGHIGRGEDVAEHRPGAVIQPPAAIEADFGGGREQLADSPGEFGRAGRWVLHLVQLAREAAEVVDGARRLLRRDKAAGQVPVRRDAEDGLRPPELGTQTLEEIRRVVLLDGERRRAV